MTSANFCFINMKTLAYLLFKVFFLSQNAAFFLSQVFLKAAFNSTECGQLVHYAGLENQGKDEIFESVLNVSFENI